MTQIIERPDTAQETIDAPGLESLLAFLDELLEFNHPTTILPKGSRNKYATCPVANWLVDCGIPSPVVGFLAAYCFGNYSTALPQNVKDFVMAFDLGNYPELEA